MGEIRHVGDFYMMNMIVMTMMAINLDQDSQNSSNHKDNGVIGDAESGGGYEMEVVKEAEKDDEDGDNDNHHDDHGFNAKDASLART